MTLLCKFILAAVVICPQIGFAQNTCFDLFKKTETTARVAAPNQAPPAKSAAANTIVPGGSISISRAERLTMVLDSLPAEARQNIFSVLKTLDHKTIANLLENGKLPPQVAKALEGQPELKEILVDFFKFSETFPGLLQAENADVLALKVLKSILAQEKRPQHSNAQILESQGQAPRLRRTIDGTLVNLIQQATVSYQGMNFPQKRWSGLWFKVKKFFFPLHNRVAKMVDAGQFYQKQLERLRVVDAIVIRELLTNSDGLLLSEKDLEAVTNIVLDSPKEIAEIETALRDFFGPGFKNGQGVAIGDFDIYGGAKKIDEAILTRTQDSFDEANLKGLDLMNEKLNELRVKMGKPERKMSDKNLDELRIYHEAQVRRIHRWLLGYQSATSLKTTESYTVEDRHETQVPDGTDSKGNPKTRTEVTYTDRTVVPTFENLLSGRFDTGDRGVSGLDTIKNRASKLVERERRPRELVANAEAFLSEVLDNYTNIVAKGSNRQKVEKDMAEYLTALRKELADQNKYLSMSDSQIHAQYIKDNTGNFHNRNKWMQQRLENLVKVIVVLQELMRRNEFQLILSFDEVDFIPWMATLRSYRNWNYFYKTAIGTSVTVPGAGFAVYETNPNFAYWLNDNLPYIAETFQRLGGG